MAINVENNLRIIGRLESKRDDPRLFGNKGNKREDHKILGGKRQESSEMSQVLNAIKNLSFAQVKNDKNPIDNKIPYRSNFSNQHKMQNYPYTTQWKDGKPVGQSQNSKDKGTLDPLQRNTVNMNDDVPWCIVCQSPHSLDYCVVAQSFSQE